MSQSGEEPLAHLFAFAQDHDLAMAGVGTDAVHQGDDVGARAFDPLEEDAAAEHQHPGDAQPRVGRVGLFDDTRHRVFVHAFRRQTAVDGLVQGLQRLRWSVRFRASAWCGARDAHEAGLR